MMFNYSHESQLLYVFPIILIIPTDFDFNEFDSIVAQPKFK